MRAKHASEAKPQLILLAVRAWGSAAKLKSRFYFFVPLAKNLAGFLEARPLFYGHFPRLPARGRQKWALRFCCSISADLGD
jgi:hypothetical protein